ncbi:gluconeogenesis factor YvcK family protein [Isobaculum melis]|uniref:Putative gluconeogenesis factor n=1 Tax=Isobaculum melis TaxID=142588 RepID=A0A1H9QKA1_9LACT|nr:YvcK family protein [Isobaculum melis]SER60203.1 conserved hypothetical protein, cofD-related [Isobaculum melis]
MIKKSRRPNIVVIGGGTGLPVILRGLRAQKANLTAIVTVADDGGSSGTLRETINIIPPGDIRNVLVSLADLSPTLESIFQYRFNSDDEFLSGHAIGNLIISALTEMKGSIFEAIEVLSELMHVDGQVLPAAEEALILHAEFEDGTTVKGESKIALDRKAIKKVHVETLNEEKPKASPKVIEAIMEADMVVLGPGSLFTSILPNLMVEDIGKAVCETKAEVVYICNIMTQLGETENFSDADHIRVLHQHLGQPFVNTVLVNTEPVPENYMDKEKYNEYLLQVRHNFNGLREEQCRVISANFLKLRDQGVFHDGDQVVAELFHLVFGA